MGYFPLISASKRIISNKFDLIDTIGALMNDDQNQSIHQSVIEKTHNHYLFVDLETGGLYPTKHPILQVAAVITDLDFKVQSYFMSYLKPHPELEVSEQALSINRLNWDDLQNAPAEEIVAQALQQFTGICGQKARFAGYNCQFDLEFLSHMWKRQNTLDMPYQVPWLDIYSAAKSKLGNNAGLPNFKLASVASHFGVRVDGAHDALQDLLMTIEIAKQLKAMPHKEDIENGTHLETAKFTIKKEEITVEVSENSTSITVETIYSEQIVPQKTISGGINEVN
jgi:DNA polymerase III alpha subunit (gram-positive type)